MKAAIYSRKSKFTGKGESVENQIQLCREYGIKHLDIDEKDFVVYEDEGFSGKNTNRPQFQKLLTDARSGKVNIIICYRLDRISRNVSDFANLIESLNRDNIGFVSIKEQFDTTTPMGRAMMYIASVFSQLERETIAERIKDNMLQLARTGRWLGGVPPTGYRSHAMNYTDPQGKEKKQFKLKIIEDEAALVRLVYSKYMELKSITMVERYLADNNLKTKKGSSFSRHSIRLVLSNPVYAAADPALYEYLMNNNYNVCSDKGEFDGAHGIMCYNKTNQSVKGSGRCKDSTEWIIAAGYHEPIIESTVWIKAQKLLDQNKSKSYRRVKSTNALLSGILLCGHCRSFMRPKAMQRWDSHGEQTFYYICETKEKSKKSRCLMPNINGNNLDRQLLDEIEKIIIMHPPVFDDLYKDKKFKNVKCSAELEELAINLSSMDSALWQLMNIHQKRNIIKAMVYRILWNGEKLGIILSKSYLFPQCEDSK